MNGVQIQFRFECKVIEFGVVFESFEFDITAHRRKEMIGLGRRYLGGATSPMKLSRSLAKVSDNE